MLARSSKIIHPSGVELQTPLFVSSFSSKGFRFKKIKNKMHSDVTNLIEITAEYLTETVLLSAYDLNYYLPSPKKFKKLRFFPSLFFIDSGGYETIDDFDFSEAYKHPVNIKKWNNDLHSNVLSSWPSYYPAIIVSYDHGGEKRKGIVEQIKAAKKLFNQYPSQLNDFLIKPTKKGEMLPVDEIIGNISSLTGFSIIGLAEKELGISIFERAKNISSIRSAMDNVGNKSPIHIFGNLDPLTSAMYFTAGAEIFDGLSWLRYGFHDGRSLYLQNIDALKNRILEKDTLNYRTTLYENLIYMRNLQSTLRTFSSNFQNDSKMAFKEIPFIAEELKNIFNSLK